MPIQQFDRTSLQMLRGEMQGALDAIAAKHGIKLRIGNMTYDPSGSTFKAPINAEAGGAEDEKRKQAIMYAKMLAGVDASEPSEHPLTKGAILTELRSRGSKPFIYSLPNGKSYMTDEAGLKRMWPVAAEESPV
jgi:hypothetical protein